MIQHLLLDLDNTLYPASSEMDTGITRRMQEYVAHFIGVSFEEGVRLRANRPYKYGTTLEWLKAEYGLTDEEEYFLAVHPEEETNELIPDPALRPYLLSLGLPMSLLTNAPTAHAKRVLQFFDVSDVFIGIFDINFHKGKGKPHADCFLNTLAAVGHSITDTLFVDDHPKYIRGYKALGGKAVIVDEAGRYQKIAQTEGFEDISSIYGLADILSHINQIT